MKTQNEMKKWEDKAEHGLSEGQMQAINWLSLNREVSPNGWAAAKEVISASQARFALGLGLGLGEREGEEDLAGEKERVKELVGALKEALDLLEYMAGGRESALGHKTLVRARAAIRGNVGGPTRGELREISPGMAIKGAI